MNYFLSLFAAVMAGVLLLSCGGSTSSESSAPAAAEESGVAVNADSVVAAVDLLRRTAEASTASGVEIPTDSLREKIRQKWSRIHFYSDNGQVVRIKTYPHESISKRTEEFYFENGQLVLAVIEDDGSASRGEESINKMYYYNNGKPVREVGSTSEGEYTIKESDAEELLQEAREYLDIIARQPK